MRLFIVLALAVAAVTMTFAQSSSKQIITTGGNPTLPFSAAVKADGFIYVSGTIGSGARASSPKATSKSRRSRRWTTSRRR